MVDTFSRSTGFIRPSTNAEAGPLLLGSAFAADRDVLRPLVPHIRADDFDDVGSAQVWEAMNPLIVFGREYSAAAVQAELLRAGCIDGPAKKAILDATTAGCTGLETELRCHAAIVVGQAYRRRFETWGKALVDAAANLPEADLMPLSVREGSAAREHEARLSALRGEVQA
ncbi:hypothetical protein ACFYVR_13515 [Rhodococcus sp. NPDC003318]|uniref:hypothetical protein n=1 Tax=Rhodococcus sp. NPDC003318 TaxID=3364503 RepID=UPI00368E2587